MTNKDFLNLKEKCIHFCEFCVLQSKFNFTLLTLRGISYQITFFLHVEVIELIDNGILSNPKIRLSQPLHHKKHKLSHIKLYLLHYKDLIINNLYNFEL